MMGWPDTKLMRLDRKTRSDHHKTLIERENAKVEHVLNILNKNKTDIKGNMDYFI